MNLKTEKKAMARSVSGGFEEIENKVTKEAQKKIHALPKYPQFKVLCEP